MKNSFTFVLILSIILTSCTSLEKNPNGRNLQDVSQAKNLSISTGLIENSRTGPKQLFSITVFVKDKSGSAFQFPQTVNATIALESEDGSIVYNQTHTDVSARQLAGIVSQPEDAITIPFNQVKEINPGTKKHWAHVTLRSGGEVIISGREEQSSQPVRSSE